MVYCLDQINIGLILSPCILPQLRCSDTWHIWVGPLIGSCCFDDFEWLGNNGTEETSLVIPTADGTLILINNIAFDVSYCILVSYTISIYHQSDTNYHDIYQIFTSAMFCISSITIFPLVIKQTNRRLQQLIRWKCSITSVCCQQTRENIIRLF